MTFSVLVIWLQNDLSSCNYWSQFLNSIHTKWGRLWPRSGSFLCKIKIVNFCRKISGMYQKHTLLLRGIRGLVVRKINFAVTMVSCPGRKRRQGFWICCSHDLLWVILCIPWWRYEMEIFSALLAICAGNSPITGEFPTQRPVTRIFDVFFDLRLNKRFSKQSWCWWFETPSRPSWRHSNVHLLAH